LASPLKCQCFSCYHKTSMYFVSPACKQHTLWTVCDWSTVCMEKFGHRWAKVGWKRRHVSTPLHGSESGTLLGLLRSRVTPSSPVHYEGHF
jgi:hypothetical protein